MKRIEQVVWAYNFKKLSNEIVRSHFSLPVGTAITVVGVVSIDYRPFAVHQRV
jgi:hypothetical protein